MGHFEFACDWGNLAPKVLKSCLLARSLFVRALGLLTVEIDPCVRFASPNVMLYLPAEGFPRFERAKSSAPSHFC